MRITVGEREMSFQQMRERETAHTARCTVMKTQEEETESTVSLSIDERTRAKNEKYKSLFFPVNSCLVSLSLYPSANMCHCFNERRRRGELSQRRIVNPSE